MSYDAATLIQKYLELRDTRDKIAEQHKAELAPYNAALETIENALNAMMLDLRLTSLPAKGIGTAYKSDVLSVTCADKGAFHSWVFKHHASEFLTKHVAKEAVKTHMEANEGKPPPGLSTRWYVNINVMRS
jgi:hypothetical protein